MTGGSCIPIRPGATPPCTDLTVYFVRASWCFRIVVCLHSAICSLQGLILIFIACCCCLMHVTGTNNCDLDPHLLLTIRVVHSLFHGICVIGEILQFARSSGTALLLTILVTTRCDDAKPGILLRFRSRSRRFAFAFTAEIHLM